MRSQPFWLNQFTGNSWSHTENNRLQFTTVCSSSFIFIQGCRLVNTNLLHFDYYRLSWLCFQIHKSSGRLENWQMTPAPWLDQRWVEKWLYSSLVVLRCILQCFACPHPVARAKLDLFAPQVFIHCQILAWDPAQLQDPTKKACSFNMQTKKYGLCPLLLNLACPRYSMIASTSTL